MWFNLPDDLQAGAAPDPVPIGVDVALELFNVFLAGLLDGHIRVAPDLDALWSALNLAVQQKTLPAGLADADRESLGVRIVEIRHAFGRKRQPGGC
nr:hypothetical protein [Acidovorax delafieldii]